ncbi:hypothetical protein C1645_831878 [Glomus cerebriforme]|uniref:Uncharacterized protein n=1 Tax=Glomus cerebriforme TaxID=658196 RepID=A0A397SFB1_9GLOM|nr:hypothetical protein C1645_831878 [Glomus cerebriforme]
MSGSNESPVSRKRRLQRERLYEKDQNSSLSFPRFAICCTGSKVFLFPVLDPHSYLLDLYTSLQNFAIMVGNSYKIELSNQDIVLNLHNGTLQRISELYPSYDPLQYMLLFPNSDTAYREYSKKGSDSYAILFLQFTD